MLALRSENLDAVLPPDGFPPVPSTVSFQADEVPFFQAASSWGPTLPFYNDRLQEFRQDSFDGSDGDRSKVTAGFPLVLRPPPHPGGHNLGLDQQMMPWSSDSFGPPPGQLPDDSRPTLASEGHESSSVAQLLPSGVRRYGSLQHRLDSLEAASLVSGGLLRIGGSPTTDDEFSPPSVQSNINSDESDGDVESSDEDRDLAIVKLLPTMKPESPISASRSPRQSEAAVEDGNMSDALVDEIVRMKPLQAKLARQNPSADDQSSDEGSTRRPAAARSKTSSLLKPKHLSRVGSIDSPSRRKVSNAKVSTVEHPLLLTVDEESKSASSLVCSTGSILGEKTPPAASPTIRPVLISSSAQISQGSPSSSGLKMPTHDDDCVIISDGLLRPQTLTEFVECSGVTTTAVTFTNSTLNGSTPSASISFVELPPRLDHNSADDVIVISQTKPSVSEILNRMADIVAGNCSSKYLFIR